MSDSNVVAMLPGMINPADVAEPDADLIKILEELLSDAQSGHLRAIAYTTITRERAVITSWGGHADIHDCICGVTVLAQRLVRDSGLLDE